MEPHGGKPPHDADVTRLLAAVDGGGARATDALLEVVYGELRRLAGALLAREKPGQTVQSTALVHEAYLRLIGDGAHADIGWNSRGHIFGAASEAIRRILVEQARRQAATRHGGGTAAGRAA